MKVLFVLSGNSENFDVTPFIKQQATSLERKGIEVINFLVLGNGIRGYLGNIRKLKVFIKGKDINLIHAHYTLSGWIAVLAHTNIPIVLSLMGSDAYGSYIGQHRIKLSSRYLTLLTFLIQPFVNEIVSKSKNISKYVYRKGCSHVIPNGVDLDLFKEYDKQKFKKELNFDLKKTQVLFLSNTENPRKNFTLVQEALQIINNPRIQLISPYPIKHSEVPKYLNAADIVVNCSFMEGSPNVIKEAMACNCPVVSTNVGDINWLFGDTKGYFISEFDSENFARKLSFALDFVDQIKKTSGRERIINLGLDSESISKEIINIYKKALQ